MKKINVALVGIGNCASNLIQGIQYYKLNKDFSNGLLCRVAGGYDIADINFVAAFDIAEGKVDKDISEAIWQKPNCTQKIIDVPYYGVTVKKGPVLDGLGAHLKDIVEVSSALECNIEEELIKSKADVVVILLPTGSHEACYTYIKAALKNGIGVVNGIPVLASHDKNIIKMAEDNQAAIIGDDFKSQIGGTILHHALMHLLEIRGVTIKNSYQLNYGGNTDFLNLTTSRGNEKHKSKARGIQAGMNNRTDVAVNVSYLSNQNDNKTCIICIEGENFGGAPILLECKLKVVDSANSSGVLVDAIRCIMVAKEKKLYGRLMVPSAYFMKSPFQQIPDELAYKKLQEFLNLSSKDSIIEN